MNRRTSLIQQEAEAKNCLPILMDSMGCLAFFVLIDELRLETNE